MEDSFRQDLVEHLKKGDKQALGEFYDMYAPVLLAICMRYTAVREDAEDVMHESLIRILKGLKDFKPQFTGSFEVWIRRIAINTSLNFLREKMNALKVNIWVTGDDIPLVEEEKDSLPLPEQLEPEEVIPLIGELPVGYRTVLNLFVFENYSHKEIASELGISENTSKSQLSKARALLRKKVIDLCKQKQYVEHEREERHR